MYLDQFPEDPRNSDPYQYDCTMEANDAAFCIASELEMREGNCDGVCDCATLPDNCSFTTGTTHFCVKNRQ